MLERIARAIEPAAWFRHDRHGPASPAYDGMSRLLVSLLFRLRHHSRQGGPVRA